MNTAFKIAAMVFGVGAVSFSSVAATPVSKNLDVLSLPEFKKATKKLGREDTFKAAAFLNFLVGQNDQAIAQLNVLLEHAPGDVEAWLLLATTYYRTGEWEKSHEAVSKAIALRPEGRYYLARGRASFKLGRSQEAKSDFLRHIQSNPTDAKAFLYLGLTYAQMKDFERAQQNLSKAQKMDKSLSPKVAYYLSLVDEQEGRLPQAELRLRQALAEFKDDESPFKQALKEKLKVIQGKDAELAAERIDETFVAIDAQNAATPSVGPAR